MLGCVNSCHPKVAPGRSALSAIALTSQGHAKTNIINLYNFCRDTPDQCFDGNNPTGTLYTDSTGDFFGTTLAGGQNNAGLVYQLIVDTDTGTHRFKRIYNFCAQSSCTDGSGPINVALIADTAGNLYGTTSGGGNGNNNGVVFMLKANELKTQYTYTQFYSFCQIHSGCEDGSHPIGGLNGVTHVGGLKKSGTIFKLTGSTIAILDYLKCTKSNCLNGTNAQGDLIVDPSGNIFGTMSERGRFDGGTLFEVPVPE